MKSSLLSIFLLLGPVVGFAQSSFQPCGGSSDKLWSWSWAGSNGQYATIENGDFGKPIVTYLEDLSGNGHHYHNTQGGVQSQPGYQMGVSASGYSTSLPAVGLSSYADGTNIWTQSLLQYGNFSASGEFYLAFAGMNTRTAGRRWLWGTDSSHNVKLQQTDNRVEFTLGGSAQNISARDSLPSGPILLEVWRDSADILYVWANGTEITSGSPTASGTFAMTGIGGPLNNESAWDDYAFEYIACDGLPTSAQRDEVRTYLNDKWGLFDGSGGGATVRPLPPSGFGAE